MYTDYSGNNPVAVAIATAAIIGAFIGGVTYVGLSLYNGTAITWGGLAKSIIVGAVSGAASGGIGLVAQSVTTSIFGTTAGTTVNWALLAVTKGVMHGAAQGFIQGMSGGNAGQSFITAMATSIAGDAFGLIGGKANSIVGHSLFGAVTGGIVSNMQGGNFWEGAAIGLTVGLLNHAGKKLYPAIGRMLNGNPPKTNFNKFFAEALRRSLQSWKTDLAAAAITGQSRHLFGPDALYTSGSLSVSPIGPAISASFGKLMILYGANAGVVQRVGVSALGLMVPGASATADFTKIYYSGNTTEFNRIGFGAFYGPGIEVSGGAGAYGGTMSLNFSWAPTSDKHFIIGIGISGGTGTPGLGGGILKTDTKWF